MYKRINDIILYKSRCANPANKTQQATKDNCAAYARLSAPYEAPISGDGQLGVFEGLTSDISVNGKQPQARLMFKASHSLIEYDRFFPEK